MGLSPGGTYLGPSGKLVTEQPALAHWISTPGTLETVRDYGAIRYLFVDLKDLEKVVGPARGSGMREILGFRGKVSSGSPYSKGRRFSSYSLPYHFSEPFSCIPSLEDREDEVSRETLVCQHPVFGKMSCRCVVYKEDRAQERPHLGRGKASGQDPGQQN